MRESTTAFVILAFVVAIGEELVSGGSNERISKRENTEQTVYTPSWAVEIVEGGDIMADIIADRYGFNNLGNVGDLKNVYHFELKELEKLRVRTDAPYTAKSSGISSELCVGFAEQQAIRPRSLKSYNVPSDPLFPYQWQLLNIGQQGNEYVGYDLNVEKAWLQGLTGCNVTVTVVDDGLDFTHEDLLQNFVSQVSYNFFDGSQDPSSGYPWHGTACGGIVGSLQENQTCGVGVAHNANLGGIALLGINTDIFEARALILNNSIVDIYSNSWGPSDYGGAVIGPGPVTQLALESGAQEGRGGKGSIFVWANGNGGPADDCAADGYASSIYTISVGAIGVDGTPSPFDEECSAKMVITYVTDIFGTSTVSTTDLFGRCRTDFGGTSAATPLASGSIALALEANPNLTWRDVQYLLVYTSNPQLTNNTMITVNGAGLVVSRQFGFGVLDAEALVTRARHWISVPPQLEDEVNSTLDCGISGYNDQLVTTIDYSGSIHSLEHVVVRMTLVVAGKQGDIQVELTSPSGTTSMILGYRPYDYNSQLPPEYSGDSSTGSSSYSSTGSSGDSSTGSSGDSSTGSSGGSSTGSSAEASADSSGCEVLSTEDDSFNQGQYRNWPFMSVMFWGEDPSGQWNLTISTRSSNTEVFVGDIVFTFFGVAATPEAVANIPDVCHSDCVRGCAKAGSSYCDACINLRNAYTLECIDVCPPGYTERNGYCYNPELPLKECNSPLKSTQDGSCVDAGFDGCCTDGDCNTMEEIPFFSCFCDAICYRFDDCCDDIALISCFPENGTEAATTMSYIELGVTDGVETYAVLPFLDFLSEPIFVQFPFGYQTLSTVYVGTNGYFTFQGFLGYTPFIFNENTSLALVAPFFTDIDISRGVGQIIYENHTLSTSKDLISRVDYIINEQTQANFKGKWMLVATWEDVPQFGSDYNITSTFQGILVTNFVRSFAVFIYYCGDLNFIRNDVTIGFVTGDGLYDVHEATLRSNAVAIACLNEPNSPWVNVVYEVAASNSAICEPPCDNGDCIDNNTCLCIDGYTGPTCSELADIATCPTCESTYEYCSVYTDYECRCYEGSARNGSGYCERIEGSCVANCGRFEECGNLTDYECECIDGYYDYEEEDYCQDINECEEYCRQGYCINTEGGFICVCGEGYYLSQIIHECISFDSEEPVRVPALEYPDEICSSERINDIRYDLQKGVAYLIQEFLYNKNKYEREKE